MGRFDFQMPDGFIKQLGRLADVEKYAPEMLKAATPIVVRTTQSALKTAAGKDPTGLMVESVKATKIVHNKNGWFVRVGPSGIDTDYETLDGVKQRTVPIRNMEKAAYLEYGTSKQSAKPWANRATNDAAEQAMSAMREAFEREVGK